MFMEKLRGKITKRSICVVLSLMICSAFLCVFFEDMVSSLIQKQAITKNVTITSSFNVGYDDDPDLDIRIVNATGADQGASISVESLLNSIQESQGFTAEYSSDGTPEAIVSISPTAEIVFSLPFYAQTAICFETGDTTDRFQVIPEDGTPWMPWNPETGELGDYILIYPFRAQSASHYLDQYLFAYVLLFLLCFACCGGLYLLVACSETVGNTLKKTPLRALFHLNRHALFLLGFVGLFAFLLLRFQQNPNDFHVGNSIIFDAYYYLYSPFFDEAGKFSLTYFFEHALLHRGIYQSFLYLLCRVIAEPFQINPQYLHFVFISLAISSLFSYFIPKLFQCLVGTRTNNISMVLLHVLFVFYWFRIIGRPLSDTLGCVFLVMALTLFVSGLQNQKRVEIAFSGVLLALAANWRSSYSIISKVGIAILLAFAVWALYREMKERRKPYTQFKKFAVLALLFIGCFYITQVPQSFLYYLGGIDPFASTNIFWRADYANNFHFSMIESTLTGSLRGYSNMCIPDLDAQMFALSTSIFPPEVVFSYEDFAYTLLNHPLQYLIVLAKRIFWSMSFRPLGSWPLGEWTSTFYIQLILTWLSQITILYALFSKKLRALCFNSLSLSFLAICLMLTAVPQILLSNEARYFMFPQLLLMLYSFAIIGSSIFKNKEVRQEFTSPRFLLIACLFLWGSSALYFTMEKNFIQIIPELLPIMK